MTVDPTARKAVVYAMQKIVYDNFYYTQLMNHVAIDAHGKNWVGLRAGADGYSKVYYTSPRQP